MRQYVRNWVRNRSLLGKEYQKADTIYGLDSTWYKGYDDPVIISQDSLEDARMGLSLSDVTEVSPNVRMVILMHVIMAISVKMTILPHGISLQPANV